VRLLLDTHIVIALCKGVLGNRYPDALKALATPAAEPQVSVASMWEIAIKTRLGKLDVQVPLERLADVFDAYGIAILPINHRHAVAAATPEPATKDPFDRMLLVQCRLEGLQLVTDDRALAGHPLAWRG
jgi:PIN domain nuclease of toxin-antitoxin system